MRLSSVRSDSVRDGSRGSAGEVRFGFSRAAACGSAHPPYPRSGWAWSLLHGRYVRFGSVRCGLAAVQWPGFGSVRRRSGLSLRLGFTAAPSIRFNLKHTAAIFGRVELGAASGVWRLRFSWVSRKPGAQARGEGRNFDAVRFGPPIAGR